MTISHLNGFWWPVGAASYALLCMALYPMLRIAKDSDQRIAEMGGK